MKLAYLHPDRFTPLQLDIKKPYFLIRLSQLNAHHDFGIKGLNEHLLDQIIAMLSNQGRCIFHLRNRFHLNTIHINWRLSHRRFIITWQMPVC